MIGGLGDPHPFLGGSPPLGESPALGKGQGEETAGLHGGQTRQAEALLEQLAMETYQGLLAVLHCPTIVPQAMVDTPQVGLRRDREADIFQVSGNRQGTLTRRKGMIWIACQHEMGEQIDRDPSQSVVIAHSFSEGRGVLQADEDSLKLAQERERIAQVEAELGGQHLGVRTRWEMSQRVQCLLEGRHRFVGRRVGHGPGSGLAAVGHSLVPHLPAQGMVRQALDLLGQPVGREPLQGLHNAGVQRPPTLLEEAAAGHLVGEGVLEGVAALGKQAGLLEELRRLQLRQASAMACSSGQGTSVPMTVAVWSRRLSSGGSRSMRAASCACNVSRGLAR